MAFTAKFLFFKIMIGQGDNGEDGSVSTEIEVPAHQSSVTIEIAGNQAMGLAQVRIYGLPLTVQNSLSSQGLSIVRVRKNTIVIAAGDLNGVAIVYQGTIGEAWSSFEGAPDTFFNISCYAGQFEAMKPTDAVTFKGTATADSIMSALAAQAGLAYINHGVTQTFNNPYHYGTIREQMRQCAEAGGFDWIIDNGALEIWPFGASRGSNVVEIGPDTGMIGYPTVGRQNNVRVMLEFNPALKFGMLVNITTSLTPAAGVWKIYYMIHELDSLTPDGKWQTTIECNPPDTPGPVS